MVECECGHKNPDDSKFCSNCGSHLTKRCPSCNKELPVDSKFCSECGKSFLLQINDHSEMMGGNVVAGDMHTTVIYNQERKTSDGGFSSNVLKCHICRKELSSSSKSTLRCDVCGLWFCSDHIDIRTHLCQKCCEKSLAEFEYLRRDNGKYAIMGLKNKSSLSITVPECVESIEDGAFEGCGALTITLPRGLLKIGNRAFANSKELINIRIPTSVKIIGDEAFKGCTKYNGLTEFTWLSVGKDAFEGTTALENKRKTEAFFKKTKKFVGLLKDEDNQSVTTNTENSNVEKNNETPNDEKKSLENGNGQFEKTQKWYFFWMVFWLFLCPPVGVYYSLKFDPSRKIYDKAIIYAILHAIVFIIVFAANFENWF